MPIKSYLVSPFDGNKETLINELSSTKYCEVIPSTNHDLIVLVTDTPTVPLEKELLDKLQNLPSIKSISLVSGYDE